MFLEDDFSWAIRGRSATQRHILARPLVPIASAEAAISEGVGGTGVIAPNMDVRVGALCETLPVGAPHLSHSG